MIILYYVVMQGYCPPAQAALEVYHLLSDPKTALRQPVGLEQQLLNRGLDSDVGQSMLLLLQVRLCSTQPCMPYWQSCWGMLSLRVTL